MFDAIAPRYDLVNRIMTFRLDVRWRRRTVRDLALAERRRPCSTSHPAPATSASTCANRGLASPISMDLSYGMLAADRSGAARDAGATSCDLPVPRRLGRRRHVWLRAAQPARTPGEFFARAGSGRAPGRPDRLARRGHPDEPGDPIRATTSTSARWCRRSARCSPTARPTATCPRASPTCPAPAEMVAMLRRAGFADASHHLLSGGLTQQLTRHPRLTLIDARRHRPARHATSTSTTSPADDGYLFVRDGVGFAGRGVAARVPVDEAVEFLARSSTTIGSATPTARSRSAHSRSCQGRPPNCSCRRSSSARAHDGRRVDHHDRPTPTSTSFGAIRAGRPSGEATVHDRARRRDRALPRRPSPRHATQCGHGRMDKAVIARPITSRVDQPIDVHAVLRRLKAIVRVEPPILDRRLRSAPRPSCWSPSTATTVTVVPARRHDAHHRRSRARRSAGRRAPGQRQEPDRTPGRDRDGPRHPAALLQLPRLVARAVDRQGRQRAAPRLAGGGQAVATRADRDRSRARPPADTGGRRLPARTRRSSSSPRSRVSTAACTAAPSAGVDGHGNGPGRSRSAVRRSRRTIAERPARRRRRHRRRQRTARRTGRDAGQVPGDAQRDRPALMPVRFRSTSTARARVGARPRGRHPGGVRRRFGGPRRPAHRGE